MASSAAVSPTSGPMTVLPLLEECSRSRGRRVQGEVTQVRRDASVLRQLSRSLRSAASGESHSVSRLSSGTLASASVRKPTCGSSRHSCALLRMFLPR